MPLTLGFLMDPIESVVVHHDSTFALMLEAQARGHTVRYFEQGWLHFAGGCARSRMCTVRVRRSPGAHFEVLEESVQPVHTLDALFMRKDPPVDVPFLHATQLVELCGSHPPPLFVNSPAGIRDANEKLFALHFSDLMPETMVGSDPRVLWDFITRQPQGTILKPVDGFGGLGVVLVTPQDRNARSLMDLLTRGGKDVVVAQTYVPESRAGDKRIILVEGEPVGAVLRVPPDNDHRGNLAAGGKPVKTTLTAREQEICRRLKPELLARGLLLVGIDVLGDFLTEVNVTSPTGLVEIDQLDQTSVEARVLEMTERLARSRA
jgi:glutathione synthase